MSDWSSAMFKVLTVGYGDEIHYVEIVRHPIDADDKMRNWIKERAYYEERNKRDDDKTKPFHEAERMIWIGGWSSMTIG